MTAALPAATPRDEVDPRAFAPVGLEPRTRAVLTAVPQDGALLRERVAGRRGTPYWSVLFAVVDGPGSGLHAELRLWHASRNRPYVAGRAARLLGLDRDDEATLDPDAPDLATRLAEAVAGRSYVGSIETATDGRTDVGFIDRAVARVAPGPPADVPAVRRVPPPAEPMRPAPGLDEQPFRLVVDAAGARAAAAALASAPALGLDIETDCGPLGSPADWQPSDGAIRLVQLAGVTSDGPLCVVVDCYRTRPDPLLALLRDPARRVIAHNIRYEQEWLAFHHGLGAFPRPLDTSCAFRILDRHWALLDPTYEAPDSRLETVMRRVLGLRKDPFGAAWWGAETLPDPQLRYAALDAAALLPIAEEVDALAAALGCAEQVRAASAAACAEGVRRRPETRVAVEQGALALIDDAADVDELHEAGRVLATLALGVETRDRLRVRYGERRARAGA